MYNNMIKLTEKRQGVILWILENKNRSWSIHELCTSLGGLTYPSTYDFVNHLLEAGHLIRTQTREFMLVNTRALISQLAFTFPFKAKKKSSFFIKLGMKDKMSLLKDIKLDYALTAFAAAELLHPYVKTEKVHAYVRTRDIETWKKLLTKKNARPAYEDEANLFLLPVEENYYFKLSRKIHGFSISPPGLVLADLISIGGLGEEHAKVIEEGVR